MELWSDRILNACPYCKRRVADCVAKPCADRLRACARRERNR